MSQRAQRVGQLIQQELGQLLVGGLKDPRIGFVTVTEVRVTPDLRSARVYVSIYGSNEERTRSLHGLQRAAGFLKRELGSRLSLKYTPELTFAQDETLDKAERLDAIISAASEGATEIPEIHSSPVTPVDTHRSGLPEPPVVKKKSQRKRRGRRR